jgi:hypothetical protein
MNEREFQRMKNVMEFIVEQQAAFGERFARVEAAVTTVVESQSVLVNSLRDLTAVVTSHERRRARLEGLGNT